MAQTTAATTTTQPNLTYKAWPWSAPRPVSAAEYEAMSPARRKVLHWQNEGPALQRLFAQASEDAAQSLATACNAYDRLAARNSGESLATRRMKALQANTAFDNAATRAMAHKTSIEKDLREKRPGIKARVLAIFG